MIRNWRGLPGRKIASCSRAMWSWHGGAASSICSSNRKRWRSKLPKSCARSNYRRGRPSRVARNAINGSKPWARNPCVVLCRPMCLVRKSVFGAAHNAGGCIGVGHIGQGWSRRSKIYRMSERVGRPASRRGNDTWRILSTLWDEVTNVFLRYENLTSTQNGV